MTLKFFSFVIVFVFLTACYTRNEACLDRLAANYDVTADDDCMDCCKYPTLKLSISQMAGDSLFKIADTLTNDLGQKYFIEDVRYYLSGFKLFQNDSVFSVREKIMTEGGTLILPNDMKILRGTDRELDIGTIRAYGRFDSLSFEMGLSDEMTDNVFVSLPTNHVLLKNFKLKNEKDETAYFTMRFKRVSPIKDTLSQFIFVTKRPDFTTFTKATSISSSKGDPIIYPIKADYALLFKNLNLNLSNDSLGNLIFENLNKMIIVK